MNLLSTQSQLPILPNNPEAFSDIGQQQYNQELKAPSNGNYVNIIPCLFEAILNDSSYKLLPRDILFFVQILALYSSALSKNQKSIIYSSEKLAKLLGYKAKEKSNMRSSVLRIIKRLEAIGLLIVIRSKNTKGADEVNELIPILPNSLYEKIKYASSNFNVDSRRLAGESNIQHILRTKLFTPIDLEFMKSLFDDVNMSNTHKLFHLNCIITAYKNYQTTGKLSFTATSKELISKNNISKRSLFNIFKYIKQQDSNFCLKVEHKYTRTDDIDCNRYDKSIFVISIDPLVYPISHTQQSQEEENSNISYDELQSTDSVFFPDTYEGIKTGVQKKQPSSAKKTAYNNKDIIIKNKYSRDIDYIDANFENSSVSNSSNISKLKENYKEEFFEDKLSLSSSKSYNNSTFFNGSFKNYTRNSTDSTVSQQDFLEKLNLIGKQECTETPNLKQSCSNTNSKSASGVINDVSEKEKWVIKSAVQKLNPCTTSTHKNTELHKELRHFYPLSSNDVDTLNFRTGREFSVNFANQLLLKLYIKYPEKRFKNKFTFISYMVQILANEKHQGPLVNHTSFRFSCNINAEEKDMLENERYLSEIENSLDTSRAMQVKKKIAGRFSTNVACSILQQVEFKINHDNSFVTALIPSSITLSERQIEILSEQLEAVYGINGYYVQEVEDVEDFEKEQERRGKEKEMEILYPKITKSTIVSNSTPVGILERSGGLDAIEEKTAWHQIRSGLIEELGYEIDRAWFSKARVKEDKEMKTLTLSMPTKFMADWLKNQYGHIVYRLSSSLGFKFIEYYYDKLGL
ncbi:hypothetical protein ASQ44_07455 (plasmid) [Rickettsia rhipicephali]|uniref:DnaA N-terminal domain-containing protein n=1 Tax=Rickettsia rhipicephali TaxID=33992 RepID=UPI00070DB00A|nr:DnaA N-terminal domain-containing protein [Rickettsia rhipicephali]ALN41907.1 hypothetical protein ASQ44_07455 [Rickettsia rhipicephali]